MHCLFSKGPFFEGRAMDVFYIFLIWKQVFCIPSCVSYFLSLGQGQLLLLSFICGERGAMWTEWGIELIDLYLWRIIVNFTKGQGTYIFHIISKTLLYFVFTLIPPLANTQLYKRNETIKFFIFDWFTLNKKTCPFEFKVKRLCPFSLRT